MRKFICLILAVVTAFSLMGMAYGLDNDLEEGKETTTENLKLDDIDNHWAKEYIYKLVDLGAIKGYPDGTFKPDNTITNAEFTKILLASLDYNLENSESGHWAQNYIDKALEASIIDEGDFTNLNDNITRGQMAKMIVRAIPGERIENLQLYENQISDSKEMAADTRYFVSTAYGLGIITGYPDGEFKHNKTATRAEASTMIIRMLDEKERKIPKITEDGKWTHKQFVEFLERKDSYKTVSVEYFEVLNEGTLSFKPSHYGVKENTIPDESKFSNLNMITYNIVKDLTQLAFDGGYYVKVFYNPNDEDEDAILIRFYESERVANGGKTLKGQFGVILRVEPFKLVEATTDLSYVTVDLGRLWRMKDIEDNGVDFIVNSNYRHADFLKGFREMIYNVYGEEDGKFLYEYALQEYDKEYETDGKRENHSLVNIKNLEVKNYNMTGIGFTFTTNIRK
ncbi:S-layer homology domain-containing protein [Wukongibacter sp. M2B1]|uniref:S-layer homology domain-containing protein n=1 Tax=Wukongibacter sp. M2B1 TaxID=3088895 RepID=UPI003D7B900F